jgi:mannose-6-phosphate isomerase-like protein (cupin superfamily)
MAAKHTLGICPIDTEDRSMTYPEARYLGETGEASATYRPMSAPPDLTYKSGNTADYLATGISTDHLFGLYRWNMGPSPSGPGPHFHRTMAESFYVLLGTIRIYDGRNWIETQPGDFVHVPPGGLHGFRNESGAPASMLIHFAPGAPREGYFEGLARWVVEGKPSDAEADAFYRLHDNLFP